MNLRVITKRAGRAILRDERGRYVGYVLQVPRGRGGWQAHEVVENGDHRFLGWGARRSDAVALFTTNN